MCVIIYNPKDGKKITEEEIKQAWMRNPDGAGFSFQNEAERDVELHKGYMTLDKFLDDVIPVIGDYNTVLHFRISTSKQVNEVQCHPYARNNVLALDAKTKDEVICMNGVVKCDYTYNRLYNDTMSYIIDHRDTFHLANQHIIDMIGKVTGSKWFVMRPDQVLHSPGFIKHEGRLYSNKYHLSSSYKKRASSCELTYDAWGQLSNDTCSVYDYSTLGESNDYYSIYDRLEVASDDTCSIYDYGSNDCDNEEETIDSFAFIPQDFFEPDEIRTIKKDRKLWLDLKKFIRDVCDKPEACLTCKSCLFDASVEDLKKIIKV